MKKIICIRHSAYDEVGNSHDQRQDNHLNFRGIMEAFFLGRYIFNLWKKGMIDLPEHIVTSDKHRGFQTGEIIFEVLVHLLDKEYQNFDDDDPQKENVKDIIESMYMRGGIEELFKEGGIDFVKNSDEFKGKNLIIVGHEQSLEPHFDRKFENTSCGVITTIEDNPEDRIFFAPVFPEAFDEEFQDFKSYTVSNPDGSRGVLPDEAARRLVDLPEIMNVFDRYPQLFETEGEKEAEGYRASKNFRRRFLLEGKNACSGAHKVFEMLLK